MKKKVSLLMVVLLSLIFLSCGSTENEILSYALGGATLVGAPVIDSAAGTVSVTVEPVDLSKVISSVTVSSGATYSTSALVDGKAVPCRVVAENGFETVWDITVTVSSGISFTYGTTDVVLMNGGSDSVLKGVSDTVEPFGTYYTESESTGVQVYEDVSDDSIEVGRCYFSFEGNTAGDKSDSLDYFSYYSGSGVYPSVGISMNSDNEPSFEISTYGDVGGYITGTFSCTNASFDGDDTPAVITKGFFKVLRLADGISAAN